MAISVPIVSTWDATGIDKSVRDIQKAEGGWAKTGVAMEKAALPAAAALGAIGAASYAAVQKASDLGETFNAVNKTFGESSSVITKFGETAAESAGLSQRAFQEMATKTGAMLTNMGYSSDEAAQSTIDLATRAADMASVFNTDVATAMEAINAGLRGEAEPLRAFGVGLSDASIKAQAMAMGLYDGKGAIDANAKALATEALVLQQTEKYAGDFAETSDSMANKQRIAAAEAENVAASYGEVLMPIMEKVLAVGLSIVKWAGENQTAFQILIGVVAALSAAILVANGVMKAYAAVSGIVKLATDAEVVSKLKSTAAWIANTAAAIANRVAILAGQAAMLVVRGATMAWTAAQWLLNAALLANPIGLVVLAIAALVAAIVIAYKNSDTFRAIVDKLWQVLKTSVVAAFKAVSSAISTMVDWLKKAWEWVQKLIDKISNVKMPSLGGLGDIFGKSTYVYNSPSGATPYSAPTTRGYGGGGQITINLMGTGYTIEDARVIKRALEGYDVGQGRSIGAPLAKAW